MPSSSFGGKSSSHTTHASAAGGGTGPRDGSQKLQASPEAAAGGDLGQRLQQLLQRVQAVRARGWGPDDSPEAPGAVVEEVSVRGL